MNFCKDCKYSRVHSWSTLSENSALCSHEKAVHNVDFYSGHKTYRTCLSMRNRADSCGEEARYFESAFNKTSFLARLFGFKND